MQITEGAPVPLYVTSMELLGNRRVRRILELAGYGMTFGFPRADRGAVAIWGGGRSAKRGLWLAKTASTPLIRLEDAFLRSLHPGRSGDATIGLLLDRTGLHHDASSPSDIETLLTTHDLDDRRLLSRARDARAAMERAQLSKYAATIPGATLPPPGYVVVVDQIRGDAATRGADAVFRRMLTMARSENPNSLILIKSHPEATIGLRPGHYTASDLDERTDFFSERISPWELFSGAKEIYTYSSTLGLEAIWAGQRPKVFGTPIYAGWGLTTDHGLSLHRRNRRLDVDQLFAATMVLAPIWYDPYQDRLCEIEDVIAGLDARARGWREDRLGWVASGLTLWKRPHFRAIFGQVSGIRFSSRPSGKCRHMAWGKSARPGAVSVEDGFLRSRGLGAELTPPISLVLDDLGIHFNPIRESRIERLITASVDLPLVEIERARRLRRRIAALGLSKYNIRGNSVPDLPGGPLTLVVGQVENDASVLMGAGEICTNRALLDAAIAARPGSTILYKPHPDVEAGLRYGAITPPEGVVAAPNCDPAMLLSVVDEVWTMTSLLGFEALIREIPVTVTGAPFYAGWGLTRDLGPVPGRRTAYPTLDQLTHAALIGYPRYHDPVTNMPCPVEIAVERLAGNKTQMSRGLIATLNAWRAGRPSKRPT